MFKHLGTINNHAFKYADDIYIYGSIDQASSVYRLLEAEHSAIGLTFNPAKSELYLPAAPATQLGHIEHLWHETKISSHGATCSGAPVGSLQWAKNQLDSRPAAPPPGCSSVQATAAPKPRWGCFNTQHQPASTSRPPCHLRRPSTLLKTSAQSPQTPSTAA